MAAPVGSIPVDMELKKVNFHIFLKIFDMNYILIEHYIYFH